VRARHDQHVRRCGDDLTPQARRKRIDDREQSQVDLAALELGDQTRRTQPRRPQLHRDGRMPLVITAQQPRHIDEVDARHEPHRHGPRSSVAAVETASPISRICSSTAWARVSSSSPRRSV
jgi:hypothetical protein